MKIIVVTMVVMFIWGFIFIKNNEDNDDNLAI